MEPLYKNGDHEVIAVKAEKVSNGALTIHLHCCSNPDTEHRHTIYEIHKFSQDDLKKELQDIAKIVGEQHASMDAAHKFITDNFVEEVKPHKSTMELHD